MYIKLFENFISLSRNKSLNKKQFEQILNEHCSDFKWTDRPIYRSFRCEDDYYFQNAWSHEKTYKHDGVNYRMSMQSENNYPYTILMNHLPSWKDYPKRQLICSTSMRGFYPMKNYLFRVIPFNNSKWGIVPNFDIHNAELDKKLADSLSKLFSEKLKRKIDIKIFMDLIHIGNISNFNDLLNFCKQIETEGRDWTFSKNPRKPLTMEMLNELFSPELMKFQKMNYSDYIKSEFKLPDYRYHDKWDNKVLHFTDSPKIYDVGGKPDPGHEIWTDSNVLLIKCDNIAIPRGPLHA